MGREAVIRAEVADRSATVTALLESTELILRAPIGRRFARAGITDVVVDGEELRLRCGSELVVLHLGERAARSWATAITTPPPSLREKLGLAGSARAMLVGEADDPDLAAAIRDSLTLERDAADMIVARVSAPDDVREALAVLEAGAAVPVWAVYAKGRNTAFGDAPVRELLRGAGLRDTKTCAVSAALTATRYHPPRA